ncbi:uncharacterized protein EV420DRAFT_1513252 [Desarmillaria tabescens]|uniref:NUDE domain-containing protein n=1 Tax=Armillaria tabescens TaxID=1929756 RepID=A0AA39NGG5_ARMTA|nr:uncharacterized protein EV420DRAFT_1513252 [Desarmillaria tabescens]KAK0465189.1 hypothetical protein EV420DRAFT_1513252 [Desarmillaria tabescens]
MTAVLLAKDVLRRERVMSMDDVQLGYSSSTDWRAKYNEVADMLAETRAELDDFHLASKELETELENELQRTEKAQQDLKVKAARAEIERDEWKSKFMTLQTNHNTTTTSLQRELDKLRQDYQQIKVQLRELEMGNDDLERTERAVSSSLADVEAKYSRALEEKILLEHELLDKANLEEQCQRLKDELRDANIEVSVLKDQLAAQVNSSRESISSPSSGSVIRRGSSSDDLFNTPPPADLQLSELDRSSDSLLFDNEVTPKKRSASRQAGQSVLLNRAGFQPMTSSTSTPPRSTGIPRSTSIPSPYSSSRAASNPSPITRKASNASTTSTTSTTSKSKGVQMVSEMRARVRTLEQKIHSRVPRLRMGSVTNRLSANAPNPTNNGTSSSGPSKSIISRTSWENPLGRRSSESRRSVDIDGEKMKKDSPGDSSGWVLIMEDSPPPRRDINRERRRLSSPSRSTSFRPHASASSASPASPTLRMNKAALSQSTTAGGMRRPQSRLSIGSSATTSSTVHTPTSRPSTPTFLPIPAGGVNGHSSGLGLKRSTGPAGHPKLQTKRSSLGSSTSAMPPPAPRDKSRPVSSTPASSGSRNSTYETGKALPQLPTGVSANVTVRQSKLPSSSTSSALSQSRIGRPSGGGGTRRQSAERLDSAEGALRASDLRPRAGSASAKFGKSVS